MPRQRTAASPTLRRRRRLLGGIPVAVISWAVLTGLPFGASTPKANPGTLRHQSFDLTGSQVSAGVEAAPAGVTRSRASATAAAAATTVEPGWTAHVAVDSGTEAASVTWTGAAEGQVSVRGRTHSGWTAWTPLEGEADEGPDRGPAVTGDLAWFGKPGVAEIEVRVDKGTLANVKVQAMRYDEPRGGTGMFAATPAGAADTRPSILPRSDWTSKGWAFDNADCASGPQIATGGVKFAVVHHSVNSNTYSQSDVPAMLASIYQFHTSPTSAGGRGWCDIAYNFVVDRFGRTWQGRSGDINQAVIGGHAAGFNTNSVGVVFLGQYNPGDSPAAVQPSAAALTAAGNVIGWKLGLSGLDPNSTVTYTAGQNSTKYPKGTAVTIKRVVGHRDVGSTDCPGQLLYDSLATIRSTAASVAARTTPTIPPPTTTSTTTRPGTSKPLGPFATSTALVNQAYRDLLRRSPTTTELASAVSAIDAKTQTAEGFLASLDQSSEMDRNVRQVARLYRAYFLRNPDHGGMEFWVGKRRANWSLDRISNEFSASPEFVSRYGALDSGRFVDLVYGNVLNRASDQAGRAYWVTQLGKGLTRGKLMTGFSESPEYVSKTSAGITVVTLYDAMLQSGIPQSTYNTLEPALRLGSRSAASVARYMLDLPAYAARF